MKISIYHRTPLQRSGNGQKMELQKKCIAGNCNSGFPVILTVVKVLFVVVCHEPTMEKKAVDTP